MRTLVEQTEREVRKWLLRLARQHTEPRDGSELRWLALHSPVILMGGEDAGDWDIHPEKPAILIGTQDMLLSRALNRGWQAATAGRKRTSDVVYLTNSRRVNRVASASVLQAGKVGFF